jgi:hypothetical protein
MTGVDQLQLDSTRGTRTGQAIPAVSGRAPVIEIMQLPAQRVLGSAGVLSLAGPVPHFSD